MIDLRGLSRSGLSQLGWRGIALRLLLALLVIAAIAFFARNAGKEIVALEAWIASKGIMGGVVTVLGFLVCVTVMVYIGRMAKKALADGGAGV